MNHSLDPQATWDDQGLWFALVFNGVALAAFGGFSLFLLATPSLWLRRLYCTNHTTTVTQGSGAASPKKSSGEASPVVGTANTSTAAFSTTSPLLSQRRVGCVLPYRCSLFSLPHLRDWLSVEEEVAHLESVIQPDATAISSFLQHNEGGTASKPACSISAAEKRTRVPFDPQVALYLAFLKLFATVFIVSGIFNMWICVLSGTDDYIESYMARRDIHHCRLLYNETACSAKAPFCRYVGTDCYPVRLPGLYDLSVQNIWPQSWRLWVVGFLDICFSAVYVVAVLFFLRRVDAYITYVMRLQMEHALGHRVAVVRGLNQDMMSDASFRQAFLQAGAYFRLRGGSSGQVVKGDRPCNEEEEEEEDEAHYQCDFTGFSCLFSILGFSYYKTTRKDAIFTKECSVQQLLFPREPPSGMYRTMEKTESAMEELQEAIADQKLYLRKQQERLSDLSQEEAGMEEALMMRAPCPSCCSKIPKVEFRKKAFIAEATRLNQFIDDAAVEAKKGSAFIIFSDALAAYEFVNLFELRRGGVSGTRATIAGPPDDIIHFNLTTDRYMGWLRTVAVIMAFTVLLFFWAIPVGFVSSLNNLAYIPGIGKSVLNYYMKTPEGVRGVIAAFLPVLMLGIFNLVLPYVIRGFVIAMGVVNRGELHGGELYLQYLFMVLTGVIFQAALQGGMSQLADLIADPSSEAVISFFVAIVSPNGGYWYAKVITATCLSTWMQFIDPIRLIAALLRRKTVSVQRVYDRLFRADNFDWPYCYSFDLTILAMGLLFHMTVPLLAVFVGLYFVVRYVTQRGRLYDRYRPKTEPLDDCTVFTASAQVIRAATWLYCLGGIGAVLFMSMRKHVGGVVLCSVSLAAGILLLGRVHSVSRHWVNSLANARRFLRHKAAVQTQYGTMAGSAATQTGEQKNDMSVAPPPSTNAVLESCTIVELATPPLPGNREGGGDGNGAATGRSSRNGDNHKNADDNNTNDAASGGATGDGAAGAREGPTSFGNRLRDSKTELLPHNPNANSRYQPEHQQLMHIDVEQVIRSMEDTVFHVERYWNFKFNLQHNADVAF
ncbi:hypothetical protein TraAM80_07159 [Trypanosoma rangeli]|uniref:CSC1/OSCA1-like 7TM region domain-containing protein n=1 Tax=Trypanosoma rangeli TaxID=5698 RepID=A0A422N6V5_TRYRA|nr:uncharacterized protein TraAM80_07159 [Trypanosoma rangeli]RNF01190.1 hypothetical protein TraAM80_07159 [Trypanosoma rangeli]|eukprot:RNF01190.1 hypothetical protein TraAM80_07159 [Trypanosoma rangeli]